MGRHAKSLIVQLGWRLSVLQVVILVVTIAALTWSFLNTRAAYIDEDLARGIARAVTVDDGVMHLHSDGDMRAILDGEPRLWFAVEDERGHRLSHGDVPQAYHSLVDSLSTLEASEVHTTSSPYELAMRVIVENTPHGRIHVIVGGAPVLGLALLFFKISAYLGTRIGLPLVLVTLVAVPWLIHRSMAGVGKVADQAQRINIDERGAQLEDGAVPRELQPLVRAFNLALERLGEGYDARAGLASGAGDRRPAWGEYSGAGRAGWRGPVLGAATERFVGADSSAKTRSRHRSCARSAGIADESAPTKAG